MSAGRSNQAELGIAVVGAGRIGTLRARLDARTPDHAFKYLSKNAIESLTT